LGTVQVVLVLHVSIITFLSSKNTNSNRNSDTDGDSSNNTSGDTADNEGLVWWDSAILAESSVGVASSWVLVSVDARSLG